MSMELTSERVCYLQCNYCNTILAVSVPYGSMMTFVTVRCGHCANLLSANMAALLQSVHLQDFQLHKQQSVTANYKDGGSSSKCNRFGPMQTDYEQPKTPPIRPPEKRQRVPSAYNRFIKEEIQRIKAMGTFSSYSFWTKAGWQ
ncbi:Putative axial regulator YABBY 2 [Striga hermonthica]|uniref:Axial regulator YABBY 2 n=1 Tax=Striga hermonthica TaxID=68872 RepID=A0A9N7NQL0_STRHE|nr:Putative axial regulator YABBY 2 [Striga hermonthica]